MTTTTTESIKAADRIRFKPDDTRWWWTVKARDHRYIIASRQAAFMPKGHIVYTVVDTAWTGNRNGVGPGVARSSLNTLGGGYDCTAEGWADRMLEELRVGTWELSMRRIAPVRSIEVADR